VKNGPDPLFFRRFRSFWVAKAGRKTIVGPEIKMSRSKNLERVET
jgi:hypothetical protein